MASNYPEEGRSANDGADEPVKLPFRAGGPDHSAHTEARAELRDRETYYTELRFAVHCQSRSRPADPSAPWIVAPRTPLDDRGADTWTRREAAGASRTEDESWDEIVARFGDTWT